MIETIPIENTSIENKQNEIIKEEITNDISIYIDNLDNHTALLESAYPKKINDELIENLKNYTLNENELNNILDKSENIYEFNKFDESIISYNLSDLKKIFHKIGSASLLVQIYNNEIKFIEKKGYQSRNQSVIDLLNNTILYKKLPNTQFIIFTNDFLEENEKDAVNYPYFLTFCKKQSHKNNLFPNFNFNHWKEASIHHYEEVYNYFTNNQISWTNKIDTIFWSGSNTNIIREKIYHKTIDNDKYKINLLNIDNNKHIPLEDIIKYKYLLNMNGYSYGGRLNYLFLSGSCVIILKKEDNYEEFFYDKFIPNVDYLEIIYNDDENIDDIINKIEYSIQNNNCENIALNGYNKALKLFSINNIYEYIYELMLFLSSKNIMNEYLDTSYMYIPQFNYFFKNRLSISNNQINFHFQGDDVELIINNKNKDNINIKIINKDYKISYNNELLLSKNYNLNKKNKKYIINVYNNILHILVDYSYNIIKLQLPTVHNFVMDNIDISSETGGWFIN